MSKVTIIKTGVANLASVIAGLKRAEAEIEISSDAEKIKNASHVLLPGVGHFEVGVKALRETGLEDVLKLRFEKQLPTMAICLGLQMLFEASEEAPNIKGLGLIKGKVERFTGDIRIPQLGWNYVEPSNAESSAESSVESKGDQMFIKPGHAYFANSYKVTKAPSDWKVAKTNYGGDFIAAVEKGNLLAAQFHPELSGKWGLDLIKRWVAC